MSVTVQHVSHSRSKLHKAAVGPTAQMITLKLIISSFMFMLCCIKVFTFTQQQEVQSYKSIFCVYMTSSNCGHSCIHVWFRHSLAKSCKTGTMTKWKAKLACTDLP